MAPRTASTAPTRSQGAASWPFLGSLALILMLVAGLAAWRWQSSVYDRQLAYDEVLSVEAYTWAGLAPDGANRTFRRLEDLRALDRPSARLLAMGIHRSLGIWREPNNHVLHSLLLNAALIRGAADWRSIRIPALLGAVVFATALFWLCWAQLGWREVAVPLALVGFSLPFLVQYGAEARGYSWMLALQSLTLSAAIGLSRRPASPLASAWFAGTLILLVMNTLSLLADWVLPLVLCLLIWSPTVPQLDRTQRQEWFRGLSVAGLVVAAALSVFLMDRLAAILSSSQQYGTPFHGLQEFVGLLGSVTNYLLPGLTWKLVGVVGMFGWGLLLSSPKHRWLGSCCWLVLAVSLIHFFATHRVPYERVCAFIWPPLLLGVGYTAQGILTMPAPSWKWPTRIGVALSCLWLTCTWMVHLPETPNLEAALRDQQKTPTLAFLPPRDYWLEKQLPAEWLTSHDDLTPGPMRLAILGVGPGLRGPGLILTNASGGDTAPRKFPLLPSGTSVADHELFLLNGELLRLPDLDPFRVRFPTLVAWRPNPLRVGLNGEGVLKLAARTGIPFVRRIRRIPAKLDFFGQLHSIEFVISHPEQYREVRDLVLSHQSRYEGDCWVWTPEKRAAYHSKVAEPRASRRGAP